MAFVSMAMIFMKAVRHIFGNKEVVHLSGEVLTTPPTHSGDLAVQVYHLMQTVAFIVMATLIMRLKVFLSPQLAVMAGILPALLRASSLSVSGQRKY